MVHVLVLSSAPENDPPLPAVALLGHSLTRLPATTSQLVSLPAAEVILLDARIELVQAHSLSRLLRTTGTSCPVIAVVTEGGFAALSTEWGIDDVILTDAGPAEIDARIRLVSGRATAATPAPRITAAGITIDEDSYSAKVNGRTLDLTYKEFQLLHFLAMHPSRVFTREQLLSEVWGYDYFGGTRTVDVHVRRLRAKLGDVEHVIGTVRNVGYRFTGDEERSPIEE